MLHTDTPPATDVPDVDYLIGDSYDTTADRSLADVAALVSRDVVDVQGDGEIAREAVFEVRADESGPVGVLRVVVSDLTTPSESLAVDHDVVRDTMRSVIELASQYNRVERQRPDRCRFIVAVDVVTDSDKILCGFIGTMHHTGP